MQNVSVTGVIFVLVTLISAIDTVVSFQDNQPYQNQLEDCSKIYRSCIPGVKLCCPPLTCRPVFIPNLKYHCVLFSDSVPEKDELVMI
ncbi:hypothetical protein KQX54_020295 [Cotesia glomerata]|uniref:Uncharacterized protein n=1 Tax=Cotesia glomerata TaxID=32391 RepID=A0AAV7ITH3_COTGL|nr:hypothetical protein KQX54_020295 [Cotesia glomerata]